MKAASLDRRKGPRADDPNLRGRRSEPRAYVVVSASTEAMSGNRRVRLLDVSRSGARIEGPDLPDAGKEIILKCGQIDSFGTIAWKVANRCGIEFDEKVTPGALVALREMASKIADSDMTPEEREAAADWASGLAR